MKKILFMITDLQSGGIEIACINLLKKLSARTDLDITLCMMVKSGSYLDEIPKNIRVIEVASEKEMKYLRKLELQKHSWFENLKIILYKLWTKIHSESAYRFMLQKISKLEDVYDIAVDFRGLGEINTSYISSKVLAKRKMTVIHEEEMWWIKRVEKEFLKYDDYLCVSNCCKRRLAEQYPMIKDKIKVCRNTIDRDKIRSLSCQSAEPVFDKNFVNLLTIGRIEYEKGYDLLIKTAAWLKTKQCQFRWYIIGTGTMEEYVNKEIIKFNMQDCVILLGMKKNPYPYLKMCDLYVQPSRREGYGIAIAEAKLFFKPIVATNLESVREQIIPDQTGALCEFSVVDFAEHIYRLLLHPNMRNYFTKELKKEDVKYSEHSDFEHILEGIEDEESHNYNLF